MADTLAALSALLNVLRSALLVGGVGLAVVATADWAARTRRISPFGGLARFMRSNVDPRLSGIERQVVRAGGAPAATPWWALVVYIVIALVAIAAVEMLYGVLREAILATAAGGPGPLYLVVHWAFRFLSFALLVRVISSWIPRFSGSPWVRWSFASTEWMLRPLRRVIPSLGMVDITPMVAYFGITLIEGLVVGALFPAL